jgi:hypothetical protein
MGGVFGMVYQPTVLMTPVRTSRARANDSRTAQVSSERENFLGDAGKVGSWKWLGAALGAETAFASQ